MELDYKALIHTLQGEHNIATLETDVIMVDIKGLSKWFQHITFAWIYREANQLVNALENYMSHIARDESF